MKTYEQLMTHYWGEIVPMAEAAGVNPWECVRTKTGYVFHNHPKFNNNNEEENYTFALTVLERRPVFVGDKLYIKYDGFTIEASVLEETK